MRKKKKKKQQQKKKTNISRDLIWPRHVRPTVCKQTAVKSYTYQKKVGCACLHQRQYLYFILFKCVGLKTFLQQNVNAIEARELISKPILDCSRGVRWKSILLCVRRKTFIANMNSKDTDQTVQTRENLFFILRCSIFREQQNIWSDCVKSQNKIGVLS